MRRTNWSTLLSGLLGLLLVSTLTGCGAKTARVSGRVVENDQPFQAQAGEQVSIVFSCQDPSIVMPVSVQPDGTFTVYGPDGDGLPPGKYKVGILSDTEGPGGGTSVKKKRVRDLNADDSSLDLDLV